MSQTIGTPRGELLATIEHYPQFNDNFIATDIFPVTGRSSDAYYWNFAPRQMSMQKPGGSLLRAPGTAGDMASGAMERLTGTIKRYTARWSIDVDQEYTAEEQQTAEMLAAAITNRRIRVDHEIEVAGMLFNETNFPVSGGSALGQTLSTKWSDAAGTPVSDIATVQSNGINGTGLRANTLVITDQTYAELSTNPQVLDRFRGRDGDVNSAVLNSRLDLSALAWALGVERVLVPQVPVIDPNDPTVDTASQVWTGSYAFLCVTAPDGSVAAPTLGRTFVNDSKGGYLALDTYYDADRTSNVMRAQSYRESKFIDGKLGYLFKNVI